VRLPKALFALTALATFIGCGPVRTTTALIDADVELEAARAAGASTTATYEYVSAEAYLHAAREAQGHSQYETSEGFAVKALALAKAARKKALEASNATPRKEAP